MNHFKQCFGMSTVGTKGQIVIPQKAREKFKIIEGEKMVFFEGPAGNALVLLKADSIGTILRNLENALKNYEEKK